MYRRAASGRWSGIGDVGNIVLRDRQNLAQNGIIIVVLTLEKYSNQLLPDRISCPEVSSMCVSPRI